MNSLEEKKNNATYAIDGKETVIVINPMVIDAYLQVKSKGRSACALYNEKEGFEQTDRSAEDLIKEWKELNRTENKEIDDGPVV